MNNSNKNNFATLVWMIRKVSLENANLRIKIAPAICEGNFS